MNKNNVTWEQRVFDVLQKYLGKEEWDTLVLPLKDHEVVCSPVITIFGVYDSGKSTLLKRLIVSDGKPVPEWLTISARRETFEAQYIDLSWTRIRDTPGIGGGNSDHDNISFDALNLSDAVLLVMPPQLLTGERETVLKLLRGVRVSSRADVPLPKEAIYIAIARMDEAGTDPSENLKGYNELCAKKVAELREQLKRAGIQVEARNIFCISADPYHQIGNRGDVSSNDYDEFVAWDGFATLLKQLTGIDKHLPNLRAQARARYVARLVVSALLEMKRQKDKLELVAAESNNERERLTLIRKQYVGLMDAARTDLDGVIQEQLRTMALEGLSSSSEIVQMLEPKLNKSFDRWESKHTAVLQKLVRETDIELKAQAKRPGAKINEEAFGMGEGEKVEIEKHHKKPNIGIIDSRISNGYPF